jgi:cobalt-zinc-cadmium efflux system membrane fusion protein
MLRNLLATGAAGTLVATLAACSPAGSAEAPRAAAAVTDGVVLDAHAPQLAFLRETPVELAPRPLLPPLTGQLAYDETRTARVSTPLAGRVVGPLPALGSTVKRGQLLLTLDSPDLATAQTQHTKAEADLLRARKAEARARELYAGKALARKDLEQAEADLANAGAEEARARELLANLAVRPGQALGRFELRAPIDGVITERTLNPALEVRPDASQPLLVISDLSVLTVLVDVFERDLGSVAAGRGVAITVPAFPGRRFTGTVETIGRLVDEATRTVKVRARVANDDAALLPAMYAAVELLPAPDERAIVVPLSALFTAGDAEWVYVDTGHGHYARRRVHTGLKLAERAVIDSGLAPGELLVTSGALLLRAAENGG